MSMQLDKLDQRFYFFILLLVLLSFGLAYRSFFFMHFDTAGLMEGARAWHAGTRYGRDIWDINPPLFMYWLQIPLLIERLGIMSAYLAHVLFMCFFAWLSALFIFRNLLLCGISPWRSALGVAVFLFILTVGTIEQFTQREIMLSFLSLPAMVMWAGRLTNQGKTLTTPVDGLEKWMMFLGGIGFLIKPHYALIYWGAVVLGLWKQPAYVRQIRGPLFLAFLASVIYLLMLWQSGWFAFYIDQRPVYSIVGPGGGQESRNTLFLFYALPVLYLGLLGLIPYPQAYRAEKPFLWMLIGGTVLCFCGALIQNKAFVYHFFPTFACIFLSAALAGSVPEISFVKRAARLCLVALSVVGVAQIQYEVGKRSLPRMMTSRVEASALYQAMLPYRGQAVIPITYDMTPPLFIAEELKMPRPMRYFGLYPMAYVYAKQKMGSPEDLQQANDKLYELGGQIAEDIVRAKYPLVMLQMQIADGRRPFDYPVLFSSNPLFKDVWSHYHYVTSADGWDFYTAQLATSSP